MDFAAARRNMVESQIRTNRVTDPAVIQAMTDVPRGNVRAGCRGRRGLCPMMPFA